MPDLLGELARRERITIFISSHLLAEIEQLCNRVGIIEKGRLVAEGTVAELVKGRGSVQEAVVSATDFDALKTALSSMEGLEVLGTEEGTDGGQQLRVHLKGLALDEVNRALVDAGIGVTALVPVQRSLEDLFLQLTSKDIT